MLNLVLVVTSAELVEKRNRKVKDSKGFNECRNSVLEIFQSRLFY